MSTSTTVSVTMDLSDLFDAVPDNELLAEVLRRKLNTAVVDDWERWGEELRLAAFCGEWTHFDILLERMRPPSSTTKLVSIQGGLV